MNEQTNTQKRGRGRPSGSKSFEIVTLAELNARFNQDQKIPVGRIFLSGRPVATSKEITQSLAGDHSFTPPQQSTIEMKLSE